MRLKNKSVYLLILLFVFLLYWRLPFIFWQQDEWHHLGQEYVWHRQGFLNYIRNYLVGLSGVRFLPLAHLANYFQYSLFGINIIGYSIVSVALHYINSILVLILAIKITNNKKIATSASLFFATSPLHMQAVSWRIQHTTTLPALTFFLLALLYVLKYFKTRKYLTFLLSVIFSVFAVFFKETALFVFVMLLVLPLIKIQTNLLKNIYSFNYILPLLIIPLIYVLSFINLTFRNSDVNTAGLSASVYSMSGPISRRLISIPLKVLAQSFISQDIVLKIADTYYVSPLYRSQKFIEHSPDQAIFIESVLAKRIMYIFALIMVLGVSVIIRFKYSARLVMTFSLCIIVLSSLPLLYIGEGISAFTFIESRYLYMPLVGGSILISSLLEIFMKKHRFWYIVIFLLFLTFNLATGFRELEILQKEADTRRKILFQISSWYPKWPSKVIFYTESDKAYYGLPEEVKIMPFQSGFGQTLLAWYYPKLRFSEKFFLDDFLWDLKEQGYKDIEGQGFGYYRNFEELQKSVRDNKLPVEAIIAFRYDSSSDRLINITDTVRNEIKSK